MYVKTTSNIDRQVIDTTHTYLSPLIISCNYRRRHAAYKMVVNVMFTTAGAYGTLLSVNYVITRDAPIAVPWTGCEKMALAFVNSVDTESNTQQAILDIVDLN